jgi:hypothetical protein
MNDANFCYFESFGHGFSTAQLYFESFLLKDEANPKFKVMWENCHKNTSKVLKRLIRRPYFLPAHLELLPQNLIFASRKTRNKFITLPASFQINFFCQIKGNSIVKMWPATPCPDKCSKKKFVLQEGEILIFSDSWNIEFKPTNGEEFIVIALFAYF